MAGVARRIALGLFHSRLVLGDICLCLLDLSLDLAGVELHQNIARLHLGAVRDEYLFDLRVDARLEGDARYRLHHADGVYANGHGTALHGVDIHRYGRTGDGRIGPLGGGCASLGAGAWQNGSQ